MTGLGASGDGPTELLLQRITMQDLLVGEQYATGGVPVVSEDCILHNCATGLQIIGTKSARITRRTTTQR